MKQAYLAGVIDCDGHICWRGGKYNAPNVGVTNTDMRLLQWLKDELNGSVSLQRTVCDETCEKPHLHHRQRIFKWHIMGYRAYSVLQAIRPYLIIKGEKADDVCAQYLAHSQTMQRPKQRQYHVAFQTAQLFGTGWN